MSFNSWTFVLFVLPVLGLYYLLPFKWQNRMLLVASCIFYASWNWRFLFLLLLQTSIDFFVGQKVYDSDCPVKRKRLLLLSLCANLGILGIFKYFNFFIGNAAYLASALHLHVSMPTLQVILPVGISFYTFHAMSYTIDIYRKKLVPIQDFWDYMLFVLYFPQLVAGPIARASLLLPQVSNPRTVTRDKVAEGLWLILWGFFKKMVVADNLALLVDQVFSHSHVVHGASCLFALYCFAFQIYCDFSGYTDIARGFGKLMGFELTLNFNRPYLAVNPSDFWQRWHISLSSWLRDYLYISLGGNRNGKWKTYRNLMLTMLLGGLWHGAAWNFVIWGGYHGALLMAHRFWTEHVNLRLTGFASTAAMWASRLLMFNLTCLGWLFFRARSYGQIMQFLYKMAFDFRIDAECVMIFGTLALFGGAVTVLDAWLKNADDPRKRPLWNWGLGPATASLMAAGLVLFAQSAQQFLYFQF
jgi:D-alanyl-lipoteichoic acid acyltransferase DltB (MBOAT superfamily)